MLCGRRWSDAGQCSPKQDSKRFNSITKTIHFAHLSILLIYDCVHKKSELSHKNRTSHGWRGCNGLCLVQQLCLCTTYLLQPLQARFLCGEFRILLRQSILIIVWWQFLNGFKVIRHYSILPFRTFDLSVFLQIRTIIKKICLKKRIIYHIM